MQNWLEEIKIEDLLEHYQQMAAVIGIEATLKLAAYYNKQGFYFTGLDDLVRRKKEDYIHKHFNGANHKELARATGYSERWVYEIIEQKRAEDRQEQIKQSQVEMFK